MNWNGLLLTSTFVQPTNVKVWSWGGGLDGTGVRGLPLLALNAYLASCMYWVCSLVKPGLCSIL